VGSDSQSRQHKLYEQAIADFAGALARVARAYELDPEKRRDLLQEIQIGLWRSFASFDGRCSLKTWVYRVAHNIGATHAMKGKRARTWAHVSLEEAESLEDRIDHERNVDEHRTLEKLMALVHRLTPLDRQVIALYLEDSDAASIAEVTGLTAGNVAIKIHRIKRLLARQLDAGATHEL